MRRASRPHALSPSDDAVDPWTMRRVEPLTSLLVNALPDDALVTSKRARRKRAVSRASLGRRKLPAGFQTHWALARDFLGLSSSRRIRAIGGLILRLAPSRPACRLEVTPLRRSFASI